MVTPREDLQDQIAEAKAAKEPQDVAAAIEAVVGKLGSLGQELADAERARRREVFRLFVSRIDLWFSKIQRGKRTECPFESGEIQLRTTESGIFGSVSRGDKTAIELFVAGVRGWEAGLRRRLDDVKSKPD